VQPIFFKVDRKRAANTFQVGISKYHYFFDEFIQVTPYLKQ